MHCQTSTIYRGLLATIALVFLLSSHAVRADVPPEVQAVFANNGCLACHSAANQRGGLSLADAATSELELVDVDAVCNANEKRVVAGDPANSILYQKITNNTNCGGVMPPGTNGLNLADTNTIRDWIISIGPAAQFGLIEMQSATALVQETDVNVVLTVNRQLGTQGEVRVDYAVATVGTDTATSPDDYVADAGTLIFADGENVKTITVVLADDAVFEGTEVFSVTLSNVVNGAVLGSQAQTKVSIQDNEFDNQPGTFFFSAVNYSVDEGAGTLNVTVIRSFGAAGQVTVEINSTDGAAVGGMDFTQVSQTLQFAEGVRSTVVSIVLLEDQEIENDEGFTLRLSNPGNGALLGSPQAVTVVIVDNDQPAGGGGTGGGSGGGSGGSGGNGGTGGSGSGGEPVVTEEEYEAAGGIGLILPLILFVFLMFGRKKA
jgi:uncharacterized membrane protein YgcG